MLTINPISRALIPVDSTSAQLVIAPNYDEFQSDREIWEILQAQPDSVLQITMAHCAVKDADEILEDGSEAALALSYKNFTDFVRSPLVKTVDGALFIYQIEDVRRPGVRQIGLLGSALTQQIRTATNPNGTIVRNEGIREAKAKGRAELIETLGCFTEIVNNAVEDESGDFARLLEMVADAGEPACVAVDERGNKHTLWLIADPATQRTLQAALNERGVAYVADGNHRSHAAAMLGKPEFLAVFFTTERMGIFPYNRLIDAPAIAIPELVETLSPRFVVSDLQEPEQSAPAAIHTLALYTAGSWLALQVRPELIEDKSAAEQIDAALVQTHILDTVFGISDAKDERITYVGGNKSVAYLTERVDSGEFQFALSLAPVEMAQFVAVCRENSFMPPKSTWFEPKVRSGLVMSIL